MVALEMARSTGQVLLLGRYVGKIVRHRKAACYSVAIDRRGSADSLLCGSVY